MSTNTQIPIPSHFKPNKVGEVWPVPYQERVNQAEIWAKQHHLKPANQDETRIGLLLIDVQNTFCIPEFELFVGGQSGTGAVDDNVRLCEFIYRNLGIITEIAATMDTHTAMQIFHPIFWINDAGEHPPAMTNISIDDVEKGVWKINPAVAPRIRQGDDQWLQDYALHYAKTLNCDSKYPLIIWPYHAMLGGISHALVSAVEEVCLFHNVARQSQTYFEMKGSNPLTENYSVLQPDVLFDQNDQPIAQKNTPFLEKLLEFDRLIIAGQAKSHCVAWTVDNLLGEIQARDPKLAEKVYLLDDCTSPVVVPGGADFTEQADAAFQRFADAGMHLIKSTEIID
ncbi:MAG: isochorismatase [Coleofasciculus sp. G3-WIS-01]|uniref:isochorismatase n=1 Tax=Coleofasciculus sp. G3-WIS-01 TaxID=3069528 RepID=UPI0032F0CF92